MKNRPFKERISYFWEYYKWHVLGTAAGIAILASLIHTVLSSKDYALYAILINHAELTDISASIEEPFLSYADIDASEYGLMIDASYRLTDSAWTTEESTARQKIAVLVAAQDLDLMAGGTDFFSYYAYQGFFVPVSEILSDAEISALETLAAESGTPAFFYLDRALLSEIDQPSAQGEPLDWTDAPDPVDPGAMEDPVAVGICLNGFSKFAENYALLDEGGNSYLGIIQAAPHPDTAKQFLDFLTYE